MSNNKITECKNYKQSFHPFKHSIYYYEYDIYMNHPINKEKIIDDLKQFVINDIAELIYSFAYRPCPFCNHPKILIYGDPIPDD